MPRKMIYIPSDEVWESVKGKAKEKGKSVSSYLLDGDNESEVMAILKMIESKLDLLIRGSTVSGFIEESGAISDDVYDKIEPRKGASEILNNMKVVKPVKPDKVILEELCDKVEEEPEKLEIKEYGYKIKVFDSKIESVTKIGPEVLVEKATKLKKTKESGWVNPLDGSKLAPKK